MSLAEIVLISPPDAVERMAPEVEHVIERLEGVSEALGAYRALQTKLAASSVLPVPV